MCAWRYWAHQDQERRVPRPRPSGSRRARAGKGIVDVCGLFVVATGGV